MTFNRVFTLSVAACGAVLLVVAPALGSEGAEGPSLFTGDLGNILWSLLTFAAVLVVLGKFAWGPILNALQKREDFIRDSLAQAKKDREAAQAELAKHAERLDAARAEASGIVEEGRRDAEVLHRKIEADARREAEEMLARAKREIGVATDTAVKHLYTLSADLATNVASRIIRKEIDAKEHERLIAESIEELQAVGGNGRDRV
jgi:F-type H+-transporting ATPase subunit b